MEDKGAPPGDTALRDQEAEELGYEAADAAKTEGEGCRRGRGHLALERGRKVGPRPVRKDRTEDMREEGKVPEWQGQATVTITDSEKRGKSPKLGLGLNA